MITFEEYLQKSKKDVDEDEMVAAAPAPASDGVVAPHGTTDADVLGKCDHDNCGGFLKKGCFHIPKPVFKKPLSRLAPEIPGGKKRKKKTWQKVQYLADAEIDSDSKTALSKMTTEDIMAFIADNYEVSYYDIVDIADIAWVPETKQLFIKFYVYGKSYDKQQFVEAEVNGRKLKPVGKGSKPLSGAATLKKFKQQHPGASQRFKLCWQ